MNNFYDLHEQIDKIAPITGVSIGNPEDKSTWKIRYKNEPTDEQLAQIQSIIDAKVVLTTKEQFDLLEENAFLTSTQDLVLIHLEELAAGLKTTMSEMDFLELAKRRQGSRSKFL